MHGWSYVYRMYTDMSVHFHKLFPTWRPGPRIDIFLSSIKNISFQWLFYRLFGVCKSAIAFLRFKWGRGLQEKDWAPLIYIPCLNFKKFSQNLSCLRPHKPFYILKNIMNTHWAHCHGGYHRSGGTSKIWERRSPSSLELQSIVTSLINLKACWGWYCGCGGGYFFLSTPSQTTCRPLCWCKYWQIIPVHLICYLISVCSSTNRLYVCWLWSQFLRAWPFLKCE